MSDPGYEQARIVAQDAKDNVGSRSQDDIVAAFEAMVPTEASSASDDYASIASGWEEAITTFAARIRRSSQSAWEGPAAESSRQAINDYAIDAEDATLGFQRMANRVDDGATAVIATKGGMPPRVHDPQSAWNPGDWFDGEDPEGDAEAAIRAHFESVYLSPVLTADAQIPVLPQPKDPVAVQAADTGHPGGPGDPGGPGSSDPGTTQPGDTTDPEAPGEQNPEEQPGEQQPVSEDTASETPTSTETASSTPETTVPQTTGSPAVTPSSTTTGTPPGTPGSPGSPAGTPGVPGAPMPGRTVQGTPGAPAGMPVAAAAGSTSGSPGMRGGMPMMGAPGAGRGGGGDDQRDRQTPEYLINEENTNELLGEEPPTIAGGVLGADSPAAQPVQRPPRS